MKKYLLSFLSFIAFASLFFIMVSGVLWTVMGFSHGQLQRRITDLKNTGPVDIVFVGSSHCYRGFDPRIFARHGYKVFNLGSSSQTPIQTQLLLDKYLDMLQPSLLVYEVYPASFASDGVESSLDLLANEDLHANTLSWVLEINNLKAYTGFFGCVFRSAFGIERDLPPVSSRDNYVKGGYVQRNQATNQDPRKWNPQTLRWTLRKSQLEAFSQVINNLKDRNIDYILVQAPITSELYTAYKNNQYVDSLLSTYGPYHNFNGRLDLSDSLHFYDASHLSQAGVHIFNEALIEHLPD